MSWLSEFFNGNLAPHELIPSEEYQKRSRRVAEYEDRIRERLKGQKDAFQLLLDYSLAVGALVCVAAEENFIHGFELGTELMVDILRK